MIVYHATSLCRGNQILLDKVIKKDAEPTVNDKGYLTPTTKGFVYVTTDPALALHYGNLAAIIHKSEKIFLYCIDIDYNVLEVDKDEIKYTIQAFPSGSKIKNIDNLTLEDSLKLTKCARIQSDIDLRDYSTKYAEITSTAILMHNIDEEGRASTYNILSIRQTYNEYANTVKENYFKNLEWIDL